MNVGERATPGVVIQCSFLVVFLLSNVKITNLAPIVKRGKMEKKYDCICWECLPNDDKARYYVGHGLGYIDLRLCKLHGQMPRKMRDGVRGAIFGGLAASSWDEINPKKGKGMRKTRCAKPKTTRPSTLH